jgi:hypothetical protein
VFDVPPGDDAVDLPVTESGSPGDVVGGVGHRTHCSWS